MIEVATTPVTTHIEGRRHVARRLQRCAETMMRAIVVQTQENLLQFQRWRVPLIVLPDKMRIAYHDGFLFQQPVREARAFARGVEFEAIEENAAIRRTPYCQIGLRD